MLDALSTFRDSDFSRLPPNFQFCTDIMPPQPLLCRALPMQALRGSRALIAPGRRPYLKTPNPLARRGIIAETTKSIKFTVERKFKPNVKSVRLLRANHGNPRFSPFEYLGSRRFKESHVYIHNHESGDDNPAFLGGR